MTDSVSAVPTKENVVTNPIAVLTDKKALQQMTDQQKQAYLLKLSNRYQQAVERFNKESAV